MHLLVIVHMLKTLLICLCHSNFIIFSFIFNKESPSTQLCCAQTELKQELICPALHAFFSLCRKKKLSNMLGHLDSIPKPCYHSNFWVQASNIHQCVDKQTRQCSLCGDTVSPGGHDTSPAAMVCVRSGHDCELGCTAVLRTITPPQSSVSTCCLLRSFIPLLNSRVWSNRHFFT